MDFEHVVLEQVLCSITTRFSRHVWLTKPALELLLQQISQDPSGSMLRRLLAFRKSLGEFESSVQQGEQMLWTTSSRWFIHLFIHSSIHSFIHWLWYWCVLGMLKYTIFDVTWQEALSYLFFICTLQFIECWTVSWWTMRIWSVSIWPTLNEISKIITKWKCWLKRTPTIWGTSFAK